MTELTQELVERAQKRGLVALIAAADVQMYWRLAYGDGPSHAGLHLREGTITADGRVWPNGTVRVTRHDGLDGSPNRALLGVAYQDPGRNQAVVLVYQPDEDGAPWEREFVDAVWSAFRDQKLTEYDALRRVTSKPPELDPSVLDLVEPELEEDLPI